MKRARDFTREERDVIRERRRTFDDAATLGRVFGCSAAVIAGICRMREG